MAEHRRRALWGFGAVLGVAALLLQATALLVHHLASPHTHGVVQPWANATVRPKASPPSSDHDADGHHQPPAKDRLPCPVWTALQALGGVVAPSSAVVLLAWVLVGALVTAPPLFHIRRVVGSAQPRAPPVPV